MPLRKKGWVDIKDYDPEGPIHINNPDTGEKVFGLGFGPIYRAEADEGSHTIKIIEYPLGKNCPTCFRPYHEFKWYWFYEASGQRFKALLYRLLNR